MSEKLDTARKAFKECNGDRWQFLDIMCTKHQMTEVGAAVYLNELRKEASCEALRESMPWYETPVPIWVIAVAVVCGALFMVKPIIGLGLALTTGAILRIVR